MDHKQEEEEEFGHKDIKVKSKQVAKYGAQLKNQAVKLGRVVNVKAERGKVDDKMLTIIRGKSNIVQYFDIATATNIAELDYSEHLENPLVGMLSHRMNKKTASDYNFRNIGIDEKGHGIINEINIDSDGVVSHKSLNKFKVIVNENRHPGGHVCALKSNPLNYNHFAVASKD
jgi:hypothetical protein